MTPVIFTGNSMKLCLEQHAPVANSAMLTLKALVIQSVRAYTKSTKLPRPFAQLHPKNPSLCRAPSASFGSPSSKVWKGWSGPFLPWLASLLAPASGRINTFWGSTRKKPLHEMRLAQCIRKASKQETSRLKLQSLGCVLCHDHCIPGLWKTWRNRIDHWYPP